jgi:DNA-directed RNA polymerase sigma subunit (sigma70/sigma32)
VKLLLTLSETPLSLDQPLGDEDGSTLGDILEQEDSDPEELIIATSLRDQIERVL